MNENSKAILAYCCPAGLRAGLSPLSEREWGALASALINLQLNPQNILGFTVEEYQEKLQVEAAYAQRLSELAARCTALMFELSRLSDMGVYVITRAEAGYPKQLKASLRQFCPPMLFYTGNVELLNTNALVTADTKASASNECPFVEFTDLPLFNRLKDTKTLAAVQSGSALILSQANPKTGLSFATTSAEQLASAMGAGVNS